MRQNFIYKLIASVDYKVVDSILETIDGADWFADDYRKTAGGMSKTNSIPIFHSHLCGVCNTFETFKAVKKHKLYDKYILKIYPVLLKLKDFYDFNFYSAFISRLHPHSIIEFHSDGGMFLETCNRIHLPLQTNEDVKYVINKRNYYWQKGNLYEFDNNSFEHGVINDSDFDRIHLVINLYKLSFDQLTHLQMDDFLNNEVITNPGRVED